MDTRIPASAEDSATSAVTRMTLSIDEACTILGISRNHGYAMAHQGALPVIRFGKRMVVPRAVVDRLLEDATKRAEQAQVAA